MRDAEHVIFVVDDDESIRESLCEIFEDEGHRALGLANGAAALEALERGLRPCLILLDLMMPIMDGWDFRERQLSHPEFASIPVVVITAAGNVDTTGLKANRVLAKPLKLEHVLHEVEQHC